MCQDDVTSRWIPRWRHESSNRSRRNDLSCGRKGHRGWQLTCNQAVFVFINLSNLFHKIDRNHWSRSESSVNLTSYVMNVLWFSLIHDVIYARRHAIDLRDPSHSLLTFRKKTEDLFDQCACLNQSVTFSISWTLFLFFMFVNRWRLLWQFLKSLIW